ncbi:hypothetical protein BH11PAT2_BH11PAT2_07350 [soil metagenome]
MQKKSAQNRIPNTDSVLSLIDDAVKVSYDTQADAAYFTFGALRKGVAARTIKLQEWLLADLDSRGTLLGIEMLFVSSHLSQARIRKLQAAAL